MANSRDSHLSDELDNINLPQEDTRDSNSEEHPFPSHRPPPHSQRDSRRVSINSLGSNASNSTVKYNNNNNSYETASLSSGQRTPTQQLQGGPPSSFSGTMKRPKLSVRHSSNVLNDNFGGSGSRRRRPAHGKRPGSSRSSIRQRNLSSDEDEDEEDYDNQQDDDDNRSSHSRARPRMSRRSTRILAGDDYDDRSGHDREQYDDQSGDEDDGEGSEAEPLTLKDRQEVRPTIILRSNCLRKFADTSGTTLDPSSFKKKMRREAIAQLFRWGFQCS